MFSPANDREKIFKDIDYEYDEKIISYIKDNIIRDVSDDDCENGSIDDNGIMDAGYTYLGQMIAHDIVQSTNLHVERPVSAKLDLDSIYNEYVFSSSEIFNSNGEFNLGKAKNEKNGTWIEEADLLRKFGKARIPDPRNDENLIISQMHLLWQKLHNKIITGLLPLPYSKVEKINLARKIVIYIFNKITIEDYLKQILHEGIYELYVNQGLQLFYDSSMDITQIPVEFSRAAFRFGHSMVREKYAINRTSEEFNLKKLFLKNPSYITQDQIVFWKHFFEYTTNFPTRIRTIEDPALNIDTRITCAMYEAPFDQINKDIRDINIEANIDPKYNIATGKQIFNELSNIGEFSSYFKNENYIYTKLNAIEGIPLWPYILSEAKEKSTGKLGLIGSIIIAEVLMISSKSALRDINKDSMEKFILDIGFVNDIKKIRMKNLLEYLEL